MGLANTLTNWSPLSVKKKRVLKQYNLVDVCAGATDGLTVLGSNLGLLSSDFAPDNASLFLRSYSWKCKTGLSMWVILMSLGVRLANVSGQ